MSEFTLDEQSALQTLQGTSSALPAILTRVIAAARGAIRAGGNSVSQTSGTVPDQVRNEVISIARWKWLVSFPAMKPLQTDVRKAEAESAQARLDKIADGKPKVEVPTDADGGVPLQVLPRITARTRTETFESQDGL